MTPNRTPSPRRRHAASPFKDPVPRVVEEFDVGDRVSHDRYGLGRVVGVEEGIAVVVDFQPQRYRILWPFAKLSRL